ncbi:PAS domain S-box protein [Prolixibacter sp. NT017]|uniref:PAS domain S-box protein n=1 Tax=Prolixibacter sp. NT017 TaxID=2652390 RepID=UPI00129945EB|nr:PAS domain S-box protein [Prolixibacter sp. NT017]
MRIIRTLDIQYLLILLFVPLFIQPNGIFGRNMPVHHLSAISDIKTDKDNNFKPDRLGDTVAVAGRVTVSTSIFDIRDRMFAIQDETGGIFVLEDSTQQLNVKEGDSVKVTGVIAQYKGLTRLTHPQIDLLDTLNRYVPPPRQLLGQNPESFEGELVTVTGIITNTGRNSAGHYLLVAPEAGSDTAIYVFNSAWQKYPDLFDDYVIGESVEVTGILAQYDSREIPNGIYQIWPRNAGDLRQVKRTPLFYVRLTIFVTGIALIILIFNIILRFKVKRHFQELTESEKRFADLAGTTSSIILIFQHGKFVYQNTALKRSVKDSVATLLLHQLADEIRSFVEKNPRVIALDEKRHKEFHYHSGGDDDIWLDYTLGPITWKGNNAVILTATDVTARKKAEEEVRRNEKLFYTMAKSAPVGIFRTRPDGYITYVNPKWSELSGIPDSVAKGHTWITAVHPRDRQWLMDMWQHDSNQHRSSVTQYRFLHPDGRVVWVLGQATPEFNENDKLIGYVGTITDITEQKTTEELVRLSEEKYRYLFQNNPQIMWIYSPETLRFLEVNDTALKHYGYTRKEFQQMTLVDIRPREDVDKFKEDISNGNPLSRANIWRHIKKNGEIINVEITSHLFEFDGKTARLVLVNDITERLKVQEALVNSELSLNESQEIAQMGSWEFDLVNHKSYWSENCFRLFGLEPNETEPTYEYFRSRIHPDDLHLVDDYYQLILEKKAPQEMELRIVFPDGQFKWIHNKIIPVFSDNKLMILKGINVDISEKKETESRLAVLNQAVEQSQVSVLILNATGRIQYVNPNFTRVTGYSQEEVIGETPFIMRSGEHPDEFFEDMVNTIRSGKIWNGEILNKKKNGEVLWETVIITPIQQKSGKISHYVVLQEDISEKKKLFDELVEAKEKAEESSRLKSAFLANISHEIRTPMNGIMGFIELIRSTELTNDEKEEFTALIEQSGQRMLDTIMKIVEISRIDSGQEQVIVDEVNLNQLLDKLHSKYQGKAEFSNLDLTFSKGASDGEATIVSDAGKLEQILLYLLDNAMKFTSEGIVQCGYTMADHTINFYVNDTGIGMTPEQCQAIFQPFVQTSLSLNRQYEGIGLGLSIAKSYVEMLGGTMKVKTEKNKGSHFSFSLPYNPVIT